MKKELEKEACCSFGKNNVDFRNYREDRSQVIIRFDKITITNSMGETHDIVDLYVRFSLHFSEQGFRFVGPLEGARGALTIEEQKSFYRHSHLPPANDDDEEECEGAIFFREFCLGSDIGPMQAAINNILDSSKNIDMFAYFCEQLNSYVRWESIEGGPHIRMKKVSLEGDLEESNLFWQCAREVSNDILDLDYPIIDFVSEGGITNIVISDIEKLEEILRGCSEYLGKRLEGIRFLPNRSLESYGNKAYSMYLKETCRKDRFLVTGDRKQSFIMKGFNGYSETVFSFKNRAVFHRIIRPEFPFGKEKQRSFNEVSIQELRAVKYIIERNLTNKFQESIKESEGSRFDIQSLGVDNYTFRSIRDKLKSKQLENQSNVEKKKKEQEEFFKKQNEKQESNEQVEFISS
jgi:hypothetical protein